MCDLKDNFVELESWYTGSKRNTVKQAKVGLVNAISHQVDLESLVFSRSIAAKNAA
jgi:hypothetical protein